MRRPAAVLLAVAAVAGGTVTAGCGADEADPRAAVADAAAATQRAGGARVVVRASVTGGGSPIPVTVTGRGVAATRESELDLTFDLGPLLALTGAGGEGRTRLLAPGGTVFVDPPARPDVSLPGGRQWIAVDLRELSEVVGVEAEGPAALARIDPASQLAALRAAGSVERVGEEEVGGTETTHYRGRVRLADYVRTLPPDRRARTERAVGQLEEVIGRAAPTPVELWVDDEGRVRRMRSRADVPGQGGRPGARIDLTTELSDFGTRVAVQAPRARDVNDVTDRLAGLTGRVLGGGAP